MIRNFKMLQRHYVKGWEEFEKLVLELEKSKKPINVFFTGNKDESGKSWCPYCETAKPVVEKALQNAPEDSHFINVEIDRPL